MIVWTLIVVALICLMFFGKNEKARDNSRNALLVWLAISVAFILIGIDPNIRD